MPRNKTEIQKVGFSSRKGFIRHIEMRVVRSILDNILEEVPKPEALVASNNSAASKNLIVDYTYDYKRGPQALYNYLLGPLKMES